MPTASASKQPPVLIAGASITLPGSVLSRLFKLCPVLGSNHVLPATENVHLSTQPGQKLRAVSWRNGYTFAATVDAPWQEEFTALLNPALLAPFVKSRKPVTLKVEVGRSTLLVRHEAGMQARLAMDDVNDFPEFVQLAGARKICQLSPEVLRLILSCVLPVVSTNSGQLAFHDNQVELRLQADGQCQVLGSNGFILAMLEVPVVSLSAYAGKPISLPVEMLSYLGRLLPLLADAEQGLTLCLLANGHVALMQPGFLVSGPQVETRFPTELPIANFVFSNAYIVSVGALQQAVSMCSAYASNPGVDSAERVWGRAALLEYKASAKELTLSSENPEWGRSSSTWMAVQPDTPTPEDYSTSLALVHMNRLLAAMPRYQEEIRIARSMNGQQKQILEFVPINGPSLRYILMPRL